MLRGKYEDELYNEHYLGGKSLERKWYEFYKFIPIDDLPEYVPKFIRGATNLSKIWLRKGMDYTERVWVLAHEITHIKHPDIRNEAMIDLLTPGSIPEAMKILRRGDKGFAIGPYSSLSCDGMAPAYAGI